MTTFKHTLHLLLIPVFCLFADQISIAQHGTPSALITQLESQNEKFASLIIEVVNENHVTERFVVRPKQSYSTNLDIAIRTWYGQSQNKPSRSIHIAHSDQSIVANISAEETSYNLDINKGVYSWESSKTVKNNIAGCILQGVESKETPLNKGKSGSGSDLLAYKIALTSAPQFSAAHGNTVTDVLVSLMGYVNQINTIYERELGITLQLVEDSEKLIFLDGLEDPFSVALGLAVTENIQILQDSIGLSNYDIGHLLRIGGGGIANIEVACSDNKGFGASGFEDAANFFLLLAHEIGHQLGAGHTWNSCSSALNTLQRSPSSAMEPGSGNTIMGYAGLCGTNNVTTTRDPFFHSISIDQIRANTRTGTGNSCPQVISVPNSPPTIIAATSTEKAIPKSTPFILSGNAFDAEGDILTHAWDQIDQDIAINLGEQTLYNPIIKFANPSINKDRYIPNLVNLANGIEDPAELLPILARNMEFRYIVRDNHPSNGNINWVDFQLQTDTSAGPFIIKENINNIWHANGTHPIEWDVANTNNATVDCQQVDILIDYDGLLKFKDTLAYNIPNDGLHYIHLPDTVSENARIMIRATDNIFFDISTDFPIRRTSAQDFQTYTDTTSLTICSESEVVYKMKSRSMNGFFNPIRYTVGTLPDGLSATLLNNDLSPGFITALTITVADNIDREEYVIPVEAFAANGTSQTINFTLTIKKNELEAPLLLSPDSGDIVNSSASQFNWKSDHSATKNILQIANSPIFNTESIIIQDSTSLDITASTVSQMGSYFWRVLSKSDCSNTVNSPIRSFGVKPITCNSFSNTNTINISNGIDSVSSIINVPTDVPIQSLQLTNIKGTHSYVGDLSFVLIAPDGQRFRLLENECNESKNFDLGIDEDAERIRCSINRGLSYSPIDNFSSLEGTSSQGDWTLRIIDNIPGDGGQLDSWELNICSRDNPFNPLLITSDTLKLHPSQEANINSSILEYQDQDNAATDIKYIITSEVTKGYILLATDTLHLGDSFSQADINNDALRYIHKNPFEELDSLKYIVTDGQGFASSIQNLVISIQMDVSTVTLHNTFGITIFPNPIKDILYIDGIAEFNTDLNAKLFHIDGSLVLQKTFGRTYTPNQWDLSSIPSGIYLLNMTTGKATASQKIIIQR